MPPSVFSINGVAVRLTDERWQHITERHPEMEGKAEEVLEALTSPDVIQKGDFGTYIATRKRDGIYLVVVYRETSPADGFVVTAYLAERLRRRVVVWRR